MRQVFCHFAFRRPKGKDYGLFAVVYFWDFKGTKEIGHFTVKQKLWENQQFVTAIQSYNFALTTISKLQSYMRDSKINQVMLITDNSILADWIETPNKNKYYTEYMEKAVKDYRIGANREITVGVGLCDPFEKEKAYKYCSEEYITDIFDESKDSIVSTEKGKYKSVLDILNEVEPQPVIDGMKEVF